MRIKVNNSKLFFQEILTYKNIDLKKLSNLLKINYSSIKKYRRGDLLIPEFIFKNLLILSPNKESWIEKIEKIENNWGASKGGKISSSRDKNNNRISHARGFIKKPESKVKINLFFCEFYGALMGDGCISVFNCDKKGHKRTSICIVGNKKLDSDYLIYLKEKLKREYNVNSYFYKSKKENTSRLNISNKPFADFLKRMGFPIGVKYGKLTIPRRLFNLQWKMQRMIIRGLFDTDGSICAKKREGYRYPQISIASKDYELLEQIYSLLRKKGYPCWISGKNVSIRSNKAVIKWFNDIGSSNNRNIFKYHYWLKNKVLPPKTGPIL